MSFYAVLKGSSKVNVWWTQQKPQYPCERLLGRIFFRVSLPPLDRADAWIESALSGVNEGDTMIKWPCRDLWSQMKPSALCTREPELNAFLLSAPASPPFTFMTHPPSSPWQKVTLTSDCVTCAPCDDPQNKDCDISFIMLWHVHRDVSFCTCQEVVLKTILNILLWQRVCLSLGKLGLHTQEKKNNLKTSCPFNQASSVKSFRQGHFRFLKVHSSGSRVETVTLHIIKTRHLKEPHTETWESLLWNKRNVSPVLWSIAATLVTCEIRFFFLWPWFLSGQVDLCLWVWPVKRELRCVCWEAGRLPFTEHVTQYFLLFDNDAVLNSKNKDNVWWLVHICVFLCFSCCQGQLEFSEDIG